MERPNWLQDFRKRKFIYTLNTIRILQKNMYHYSSTKVAYNRMYNRCIKRLIGMIIAGIALIALSFIFLLIAIAIAIEDGFPIFYRADRGGYRGKPFRICKFRSMVKNADQIGGGTTALNDPRITKVGNFLRKTKFA